jgi:transcriptional regulator with XRE-family HTH domain
MKVNGRALAYYRERLGWTQQQLADIAGYTRRVITKAEAGGSLHPDTIEVLAEAVSAPGQVVAPEDLVTDFEAVAWRIVRSFALDEEKFVHNMRHLLAEDLEFFVAGNPVENPFAGTYHGLEGIDQQNQAFFRLVERPHKRQYIESATVLQSGNLAVYHTRDTLRLPGVAELLESPITVVLHFDKGKISRILSYNDAESVANYLKSFRKPWVDDEA